MANKPGDDTLCIAAYDTKYRMAPLKISRCPVGKDRVRIQIQYCGMCHSDLHSMNGDWGTQKYAVCPGHEIAGVVSEVGEEVKEFKVGDRVGVGCMVDSCKECDMCQADLEQHCTKLPTAIYTYNTAVADGLGYEKEFVGQPTRGGYSSQIVVQRRFVFHIPENMKMEVVGPLLCAGITTFSPFNRFIRGKANQTVGVVGFGGLGHMAVKIATAMGAKVSVFSRSNAKAESAAAMGAALITTDDESLKKHAGRFDMILDTVSAVHDLSNLVRCLKPMGNYVIVGVPSQLTTHPGAFIGGRRSLHGSNIGGCKETAEMLEFCAKNNISPAVEIIPASKVTAALDALESGSAGSKRFVIDMSTIKAFHEENKAPEAK